MEGPTPVSALIHAATLVTAGIFLIIRCSPLFEFASYTLIGTLIIGGITSLFGATTACAQNDLKKIIAFSTTSQLGYMCSACGISGYDASLFHLFNHGFFKALLFLSCGVVIYSLSHQQDVRQYGNLIIIIPFIYCAFMIATFGLTGMPFQAGYYSKELIIEVGFVKYTCSSYFMYWISVVSAALTAFYSVKCLYLTFIVSNNSSKFYLQDVIRITRGMLYALIILIFGTVICGAYFKDILTGNGNNFYSNTIFILPINKKGDFEYNNFFLKNIPLIGTMMGGIFGLLFNAMLRSLFNRSKFNTKLIIQYQWSMVSPALQFFINLKNFFNNKWYLDFIQNNYFALFILKHSYDTLYKVIDKGFIEIISIN